MKLRTLSSLLLAGLLSLAVTLPVELSADQSAEAKKVFEQTKLLAEKGESGAQNDLGISYLIGEGVPKNYVQAAFWFSKAAEQGNAIAQNNLGSCYTFGRGVPKDHNKAVYWYRKAAEQGNTGAQNSLGVCYGLGHGVPKNEAEAYALWNLASITNEDARENRALLEKTLSFETISRGKQRTKEWQKLIEERQKAKEAGK